MPSSETSVAKPPSITFHIVLGALLFAFIQTFSLLSPILLSLLLVLLISLAINPMISWMRAQTGGRKVPTGLLAAVMIMVIGLTDWAFFGPMKASILSISETLPGYWERLQKPLIKIEQKSVIFEEKLQAAVSTEIAEDNFLPGKPKFAIKKKPPVPAPETSQKEAGTLRATLSKMIKGVLGMLSIGLLVFFVM